ncbi:MAG TPA: sulfotransferase [Rhizomicrobium sp.]|nr:sulfotransferase [Rhizomicrobium sp.]
MPELPAAASETAEYRYPDFLCVGAQKAGTSWLDKNLRRHPKLWLPPIKEIQYFNDLHVPESRAWTGRHRRDRGAMMMRHYLTKTEAEDWNYRRISVLADIIASPISDRWYGRIFSLAGADQMCGEVSPDYATIPDTGIAHILKLSPGIRIVLSLRDPIARSWSQMRMDIRRGQRKELHELEAGAMNRDLYNRADYPTIIENWRKFIPDDRLHVIFLDDIEATPEAVLESVCGFLGVGSHARLSTKAMNPVHAGEKLEIPPSVLETFKTRYRPIYERFAALYPEIGAAWMARHYG